MWSACERSLTPCVCLLCVCPRCGHGRKTCGKKRRGPYQNDTQWNRANWPHRAVRCCPPSPSTTSWSQTSSPHTTAPHGIHSDLGPWSSHWKRPVRICACICTYMILLNKDMWFSVIFNLWSWNHETICVVNLASNKESVLYIKYSLVH